jgi:Glutathione S-transferase N-terminal domain
VITLYSYPELSGVADNNGYGLKVFAFLRLAGAVFAYEHIFDASAAPRGQLPYIVDDAEEIGDSDTIIAHLIAKYRLSIDDGLTPRQRDTNHLILRMLDDLYWVMAFTTSSPVSTYPRLFRAMSAGSHPVSASAPMKMKSPPLSWRLTVPLALSTISIAVRCVSPWAVCTSDCSAIGNSSGRW